MTHRIKVVGVGGCGSNTVHYLIACGIAGVEYMCINTDAGDHNPSSDHTAIWLDRRRLPMTAQIHQCPIVRELECDGFRSSMEGAQALFIVAGMGGRTGTHIASDVARIGKRMSIPTIGMVTMPFDYEMGRKQYAEIGLVELLAHVDILIVLSNDRLMETLGDDVNQDQVFAHGYGLVKAALCAMV